MNSNSSLYQKIGTLRFSFYAFPAHGKEFAPQVWRQFRGAHADTTIVHVIIYLGTASCNDLEIATFQTDSFTTVLNIISVFLHLAFVEATVADYDRLTRGNYSFDPAVRWLTPLLPRMIRTCNCALRCDFGIVPPEISGREWWTKERGCSYNCVVAHNDIREPAFVVHTHSILIMQKKEKIIPEFRLTDKRKQTHYCINIEKIISLNLYLWYTCK